MSDKPKKHTAEIIDPGLGELDKVRNILFGRQVKAYEDRFSELEDSLNNMITKLTDTIDLRLNNLESDLNEREQDIRRSLVSSDESSSQDLTDIRSDMDNLTSAFGTDIAQTKGELRSELGKIETKLSSDKTDRESLAMMFDEMSMRLRNEEK